MKDETPGLRRGVNEGSEAHAAQASLRGAQRRAEVGRLLPIPGACEFGAGAEHVPQRREVDPGVRVLQQQLPAVGEELRQGPNLRVAEVVVAAHHDEGLAFGRGEVGGLQVAVHEAAIEHVPRGEVLRDRPGRVAADGAGIPSPVGVQQGHVAVGHEARGDISVLVEEAPVLLLGLSPAVDRVPAARGCALGDGQFLHRLPAFLRVHVAEADGLAAAVVRACQPAEVHAVDAREAQAIRDWGVIRGIEVLGIGVLVPDVNGVCAGSLRCPRALELDGRALRPRHLIRVADSRQWAEEDVLALPALKMSEPDSQGLQAVGIAIACADGEDIHGDLGRLAGRTGARVMDVRGDLGEHIGVHSAIGHGSRGWRCAWGHVDERLGVVGRLAFDQTSGRQDAFEHEQVAAIAQGDCALKVADIREDLKAGLDLRSGLAQHCKAVADERGVPAGDDGRQLAVAEVDLAEILAAGALEGRFIEVLAHPLGESRLAVLAAVAAHGRVVHEHAVISALRDELHDGDAELVPGGVVGADCVAVQGREVRWRQPVAGLDALAFGVPAQPVGGACRRLRAQPAGVVVPMVVESPEAFASLVVARDAVEADVGHDQPDAGLMQTLHARRDVRDPLLQFGGRQ